MRWPLVRVAIAGPSMLPTLVPGEWWLARRTARIRPGDIVVFHHPALPGALAVKRADHRVGSASGSASGPASGSASGWWLLGDNPGASTDSRREGPVPDSAIVGTLWRRYRPLPPRRPGPAPTAARG